jgi:outer membrane murein-binding lipoprotein Lpp
MRLIAAPPARLALMAVLVGASTAATCADDLKVSQLEQDVRELQRQVQALSQQVEAQRAQAPAGQAMPPVRPAPAPTGGSPAWVDAAKWQKLLPGMSELEVIALLGPPTSMRSQGNQHVLFYALEIGSSGFLSGSVTLRDRVVTGIQKPTLQ